MIDNDPPAVSAQPEPSGTLGSTEGWEFGADENRRKALSIVLALLAIAVMVGLIVGGSQLANALTATGGCGGG